MRPLSPQGEEVLSPRCQGPALRAPVAWRVFHTTVAPTWSRRWPGRRLRAERSCLAVQRQGR
eukprot:3007160-Alexandrium_andersonii.AAC.1